MAEPIDYYVAALVDGIEQTQNEGTRADGACALPISRILNHYSIRTILDSRTLLSNDLMLKGALRALSEGGFVEVWEDDIAETIIYIENPQSLFDSMVENTPFQRLYMLGDNGHSWLASALVKINNRASSYLENQEAELIVDAETASSDRHEWQPLPVDLADPNLEEAISLSEEAIAVIEASNGYADSEPGERNSIVESMKGSLQSLKSGMPSRKAILEGLYAPMKFIAKKFTDAAMGKAATAAVAALAKWLFGI
ncbi:hypothetical protein [Mesorhizobium erdmanii]|uniref:Uncharacterized protein n=1 Tax=Mesorhizobium erdmanii TaxID=1777866 RepID=A0A6M7UL29_9HYPH|nr:MULTISPECIES: hypothetical protein [Mesorhizobium]OBQ74636.1 hypothetical protein A8146_02490 [Mesorhizobium loti]QKC76798.1 hypothetical protein EB233_15835 [Mesorhizobium erdmanii]